MVDRPFNYGSKKSFRGGEKKKGIEKMEWGYRESKLNYMLEKRWEVVIRLFDKFFHIYAIKYNEFALVHFPWDVPGRETPGLQYWSSVSTEPDNKSFNIIS